MYQLAFYVPVENVEEVKAALFAKGAGRYENYDCCCWQVLGEGQFRPLQGADPHIGKVGQVEKVPEYKVEMICTADIIEEVIAELIKVHPYEEPAYTVIKLDR
ncbi:MAG: NGG1p interacting factor NIF3 [Candidatus Wallacebacter cryptica]|jgi:hypothetical protein|nr:NGG1p interacting factor NIF3 [Bacillota bacterium]